MSNSPYSLEAALSPVVFEYCQKSDAVFEKMQSSTDELDKIFQCEKSVDAANIDVSTVQSSCSVQNIQLVRAFSEYCFDEKGRLCPEKIAKVEEALSARLFAIRYGCEERRRRYEKLLTGIKILLTNTQAQQIIHRISRPMNNRLAEIAIRDTLLLADDIAITDAHARRAVLCAFLTTLRQSLGSCFATAPAILVQEHEPILFLTDIEMLMSTAQLKRVVNGNEYSVPLCSSYGKGDLQKPLCVQVPLWKSAAKIYRNSILLKGLQKVGIISETTEEEGFARLAAVIEACFSQEHKSGDVFYTSLESILQKIVQHHLQITPKEMDAFKNRPKMMVQQGVVISQHGKISAQEKKVRTYQSILAQLEKECVNHADCALLKMWEFTVASFAEVKFDLARYNFYASLGVNYDDVGGIGQVVYEIAKHRVDEAQRKMEEYQQKLDAISYEVDMISRRMEQASTETEISFIKMEYQTRRLEQQQIKEEWERYVARVNKIAKIHTVLIDRYEHLLKEYFQEIYDPDLHDVAKSFFDDSPAGFRLIYKHGRSNPALWTKITSAQEYIDAIVSFITLTEQELLKDPEIVGIEQEFTSIITRLAGHIRSDQFLESAFIRMARAHQSRIVENPLQHMDQIEKKPWVYTSGGSLNTLVASYFGLNDPPEEKGRYIESEEELCAFCIDTARLTLARSKKSNIPLVLMHSPTHAFSLLPMMPPFSEAIDGDAYSYTWIRNRLKDPYQLYYSSLVVDSPSLFAFSQAIAAVLPEAIRTRFLNEAPLLPSFLRPFDIGRELEKLFHQDSYLRRYQQFLTEEVVDSMLYKLLPYVGVADRYSTLRDVLYTIFPDEKIAYRIDDVVDDLMKTVSDPLSAQDFRMKVASGCMMLRESGTFSYDLYGKIIAVLREKRLAPPQPIMFADTNWVSQYFGFVVGPTSRRIELWVLNRYGTEGGPIPHWQPYLNGSRKDQTWGILVDAQQYLRYMDFMQNGARIR